MKSGRGMTVRRRGVDAEPLPLYGPERSRCCRVGICDHVGGIARLSASGSLGHSPTSAN